MALCQVGPGVSARCASRRTPAPGTAEELGAPVPSFLAAAEALELSWKKAAGTSITQPWSPSSRWRVGEAT